MATPLSFPGPVTRICDSSGRGLDMNVGKALSFPVSVTMLMLGTFKGRLGVTLVVENKVTARQVPPIAYPYFNLHSRCARMCNMCMESFNFSRAAPRDHCCSMTGCAPGSQMRNLTYKSWVTV